MKLQSNGGKLQALNATAEIQITEKDVKAFLRECLNFTICFREHSISLTVFTLLELPIVINDFLSIFTGTICNINITILSLESRLTNTVCYLSEGQDVDHIAPEDSDSEDVYCVSF